MLLTLSQSGKPEFGTRTAHDIASPPAFDRPRYSPGRPLSRILTPVAGNAYAMSTSHRGLPPPSVITLPDPGRQQPPPPAPPPPTLLHNQPPQQPPLVALPGPPGAAHWQASEDASRHWASTKAEEEKTKQEEERRRQEEEKTRQESFKYEQRLVERAILRESIQGGVPPQMIPVIFAGIGGSNLASASVDLLQQYATQLQNVAQQMHPRSTDVSPEQMQQTQMINPAIPNPYAAPPPPSGSIQPPPPPLQSSYNMHSSNIRPPPSGPTSAPRNVAGPGLSRINTIDLAQSGTSATPTQGPADASGSSPGIYFHHWVPPASQDGKVGANPATPSLKHDPSSAPSSFNTEGEHKDSPRKRKATGGHQPILPPPQPSPQATGMSSSRSRGNSNAYQSQSRPRGGKPSDDHDNVRGGHYRKDSVATNQRSTHEGYQPSEQYSRPDPHISQHSHHVDRRDHR